MPNKRTRKDVGSGQFGERWPDPRGDEALIMHAWSILQTNPTSDQVLLSAAGPVIQVYSEEWIDGDHPLWLVNFDWTHGGMIVLDNRAFAQ